jgi:hypothetical protein
LSTCDSPRNGAPAPATPLPRRLKQSAPPVQAPRLRAASLLAVACAVLGSFTPRPAAAQSPPEYEIKAAFVYNFTKFVQWPATAFAQPQSPLIVCVVGDDPFGPALDAIDRKLAQGHELSVRHRVGLKDARSCHVLFVAQSEQPQLAAVLRAVSDASVLTISDIDRFAESGGVIGLYNVDNKVQFSVNLDQARRALLQINSQLLKLAKIVHQDAPEDGR